MDIVNQIVELKEILRKKRLQGKTVGLVPTMGSLHEGHLTLMRQAKREQSIVVASIFVNPLQFGPSEDFAAYPRQLKQDSEQALGAGVDILFVPREEDMYPQGVQNMLSFVDVLKITERLCGASRPGHFQGVATVVTKLFNIVEPDVAYFGQKDAQQVSVIKQMVTDLNMNVKICAVPIVREEDGLALSSRNVYLNPAERQSALVLNQSLQVTATQLSLGERDSSRLISMMKKMIEAKPYTQVDYIAISDPNTLEPINQITGQVLIALAVKVGKTRLIDNLVWGE